ncbi:PREDICTED: cystatin-9-like [Chrysochloris asiatica]|uniref:Cystatin-9-like n=1 Tax=Chrysochloris asiatica TaxID=185453 RepID=A0A9B0TA93_CHRAS|nr:PREDICTED: cystatin-9-like [Chrysochloris asiatica]
MSYRPGRWTWPCWVLLLLLSFLLLVTHVWSTNEKNDPEDQTSIAEHFPATVEYALHTFNLQSKDTHAYRLMRILSVWKEKMDSMLAFSMELELGRTRCRKFEDDIENCPFHESPAVSKTLSCFFTISTQPWRTKFDLLNSTCVEGVPGS